MQTYIVKKGDTLYGISKQFGVTPEAIRKNNNLKSNNLTIGQTLKIPTKETFFFYIVKKGDTLYKIARKYNITVGELSRINNLKSNILDVGEQLYIPLHSEESNNSEIYIVKRGDTLYKIAQKYNITINELKKINNLKDNNLTIGQILKITTDDNSNISSDYILYTVKAGDTLTSLAKKYKMTPAEIKEINNLKTDELIPGQTLKLKKITNYEIPIGSKCIGENYSNNSKSYINYVVKKGDNLYTIAEKYNTTVESIKRINNLKTNNLKIGQILKIEEVK